MKVIFSEVIAGFVVELATKGKKFRVTYGAQVKENLTYAQAAKELGECILHALACEGKISC